MSRLGPLDNNFHMRQRIYNRFRDWKLVIPQSQRTPDVSSTYGPRVEHLCWLLGRTERFTQLDLSERELAICQALDGPNAYAAYKMLVIQREEALAHG